MAADIGLGLLLNILFWTVAVLAVVLMVSLAVIEYFPGRSRKVRKGSDGGPGRPPGAEGPAATDRSDDRYRKAS